MVMPANAEPLIFNARDLASNDSVLLS